MNAAPLLDYVVDAFGAGSVALILCGAFVVLACQFFGIAGRRGYSERIDGRNHSKEIT